MALNTLERVLDQIHMKEVAKTSARFSNYTPRPTRVRARLLLS